MKFNIRNNLLFFIPVILLHMQCERDKSVYIPQSYVVAGDSVNGTK